VEPVVDAYTEAVSLPAVVHCIANLVNPQYSLLRLRLLSLHYRRSVG